MTALKKIYTLYLTNPLSEIYYTSFYFICNKKYAKILYIYPELFMRIYPLVI